MAGRGSDQVVLEGASEKRERGSSCARAAYGITLAICAALAFAFGTIASADRHMLPPWRVVVLYGQDFLMPHVALNNQALRQVLDADASRPIDIYSDAVDTHRFNGRDLEPEFLALMRKKYAGVHIDLVVAANLFALEFAERHRARTLARVAPSLSQYPRAVARQS